MTMLSTVLAGLPLILFGGPGAEARSSIGWVIFGGLGFASIFTLLLTPTFYSLLSGYKKPINESYISLSKQLRKINEQKN